jgi:hypothetical protein
VSAKSVISSNHYLAGTVKPTHPARTAQENYKSIDDLPRQIDTGEMSLTMTPVLVNNRLDQYNSTTQHGEEPSPANKSITDPSQNN